MKRAHEKTRARGVSLVELMVAITLGMIVLAAVSTVFMNSRVNYATQESAARLQESARVAMHFLIRDIRLAGYYGCIDETTEIGITLNGADDSGFANGNPYNFATPIEGFDGASAAWYPSTVTAAVSGIDDKLASTDAILLRMADVSNPVNLTMEMPNTSAALQTSGGGGLRVGDIALISDCAQGAIFQITGPGDPPDAVSDTVVHNTGTGSPGNSTKDLGKPFDTRAQIMKFVQRVYYVKENARNVPALYRQDFLGGNPEELVEGIVDFQVLYGVDTNSPPDGIPNLYVRAQDASLNTNWTNWTRIVSVRVDVEVKPVGTNTGTVQNRTFTSTVRVRNL